MACLRNKKARVATAGDANAKVRLGGEGVRLHALEPALPVQITATYRLRDLDAI